MSKLTREAAEKSGKFLEKNGQHLDPAVKTELETLLGRGASLAEEYARLKEEVKEKRLDIEDNARATLRFVRKAKRSAAKETGPRPA